MCIHYKSIYKNVLLFPVKLQGQPTVSWFYLLLHLDIYINNHMNNKVFEAKSENCLLKEHIFYVPSFRHCENLA